MALPTNKKQQLISQGASGQARQMAAPAVGMSGAAQTRAGTIPPGGAQLNPTGSHTPPGGAQLKPTGTVELGSTLAGTEASKDGGSAGGVVQTNQPVNPGPAALNGLAGSKYESPWQTQLSGILDQIMNRKPFSYDMNADAFYQQYKDIYTQQGRQAMMDTMGQASAMTGGYGSSYAQTAGQQQYQQYMVQLNDRIPELYQLAQDTYNNQTQNLYQQAGLLSDMDNRDYNRWAADRDWQYGLYRDTVADQQWRDQFDWQKGTWQQEFDYGKERDLIGDQQWQKEFDEAVREFNLNYNKSGGGSGGGGGGSGRGGGGGSGSGSGSGGGGWDNGGLTTAQIKAMQQSLGITPDGKWGPQSVAAAKARWGKFDSNWDGSALKAWTVFNSQF